PESSDNSSYWERFKGNVSSAVDVVTSAANASKQSWQEARELTPEERGMLAVYLIREEGDNFLGRFTVDAEGGVHRLKVRTATRMLEGLLTSGLSAVEEKAVLGQSVEGNEYALAGLEALAVFTAGSTALARIAGGGKKVRAAGKAGKLTAATRKVGKVSRLTLGTKVGRLAVSTLVIGVVITHPGVITSILRNVAEKLGLPVLMVQFVGWTTLFSILLAPFVFVWLPLLRVVARTFAVMHLVASKAYASSERFAYRQSPTQ
ncbi:MAG: hypothetical protein Q8P93_00630, partial [bacterium]|nr:hypothetical protein [bacterium]